MQKVRDNPFHRHAMRALDQDIHACLKPRHRSRFLQLVEMTVQSNTLSRSHAALSSLYTSVTKLVIPAGIHDRLSCLSPFRLMQICSRQICAGIQSIGMYLSSPSMALDTRFPAGMTNSAYLCITMSAALGNQRNTAHNLRGLIQFRSTLKQGKVNE